MADTPVRSIFFDLETSDALFMSQILNYCFIAVDENYQIVEEFSGDIKLSPLQIPTPEAILTNRIDISKHQQVAEDNEIEAMAGIYDFISRMIDEAGSKVPIIGYNSARFDIPFLRTSLIRNGINPYFNGNLLYRDLLHAVRKLSCTREDFPRSSGSNEDKDKLSLRLETICKELSLLEGAQTHHSRDDVVITIKLAEALANDFDLDVRTFESYEASSYHQDKNSHPILRALSPNYDLTDEKIYTTRSLALLDADHRNSLWIDLDRYQENPDRSAVSWFGANSSQFILDESTDYNEELEAKRDEAVNKLSKIRLNNFFQKSTCDIEQDIYRLDFKDIEALGDAIWRNDSKKLDEAANRNSKVILIRNKLARYESEASASKKTDELLKKYALYRYGGEAKISKFDDSEESERHRVLSDYLLSAKKLKKSGSEADKALIESLLGYIYSSDIARVAGAELGINYKG